MRSTRSEPTVAALPLQFTDSPLSTAPLLSAVAPGWQEQQYKQQLYQMQQQLEESQQHNNKTPHRQPRYNAPAAVDILKLEREEKARSNIAKLTGWNRPHATGAGAAAAAMADDGSSSGAGGAGGASGGTSKERKEATQERKREQVHAMKLRYLQQQLAQQQSSNGGNDDNSSRDIRDLDLTDTELSQISKYFKQSSEQQQQQSHQQQSQSQQQQQEQQQYSGGVRLPSIAPSPIVPMGHLSPSPKSPIKDKKELGFSGNLHSSSSGSNAFASSFRSPSRGGLAAAAAADGRQLSSHSRSGRSRGGGSKGNSVGGIGGGNDALSMASFFVELYMGGVEGLLNWTQQLDDVDNW
jgi:hypothetical protein